MRATFAVILMAAALMSNIATSYAHGGGCRKDSPPGQCCHAGSKPYHCH